MYSKGWADLQSVSPSYSKIQRQFVSKCTFSHNQNNSIVCNSPSVSDNQDYGETQIAMDLKICTQSYIIHALVGIDDGLQWSVRRVRYLSYVYNVVLGVWEHATSE